MNKKLILIPVFLLTSLVSSGSVNAAGILDWANSQKDNNQSYIGSAFDTLRSNIQGFTFISNSSPVQEIPVTEPPKKPIKKSTPPRSYLVLATGYSSTIDQTDDTPFITAWGTDVRDGIVATNFLPFGTVIMIPELFGNKTFVVEDRMNSRYWYNIDIWFPERSLAKTFGVKKIKIEIIS